MDRKLVADACHCGTRGSFHAFWEPARCQRLLEKAEATGSLQAGQESGAENWKFTRDLYFQASAKASKCVKQCCSFQAPGQDEEEQPCCGGERASNSPQEESQREMHKSAWATAEIEVGGQPVEHWSWSTWCLAGKLCIFLRHMLFIDWFFINIKQGKG